MLSQEAAEALREMVIEGNRAKPGCLYNSLDYRKQKEVIEILNSFNGRWLGGKANVFIFPRDPRTAIAATIEANGLPESISGLDFFPTPRELALEMARLARLTELTPTSRILEPSAGNGSILDVLDEQLTALGLPAKQMLIAVELHDWLAASQKANGYQTHQADFLEYEPGHLFDRAIMNPPFTRPGPGGALEYIKHIGRAWELLAPGGLLVAIAPLGFTFREDATCTAFRELVKANGQWTRNDPYAFANSGTKVQTVTLIVEKQN